MTVNFPILVHQFNVSFCFTSSAYRTMSLSHMKSNMVDSVSFLLTTKHGNGQGLLQSYTSFQLIIHYAVNESGNENTPNS